MLGLLHLVVLFDLWVLSDILDYAEIISECAKKWYIWGILSPYPTQSSLQKLNPLTVH